MVLIIADDATQRRRIADALLAVGYGVCETHSCELVPAVPRLDAVVTNSDVRWERFRAPVVPIAQPLDPADLLARVEAAVEDPGERAA